MDALQGRVKFRADASISFKTFYQGAKAVRQITQAGLFPANCRYLDEQDAKFYGAGDGTDSVLLLGFQIRRPSGGRVAGAQSRNLQGLRWRR